MAEQYSAVVKLSVDGKNFENDMKRAAMSVSEVMGQSKMTGGSFLKMGSAFAVAQKAISTGANMISSSMSAAIRRVDTLNQFPKVMQQLGFSMEQAEDARSKLSDGIDGLPTSLDEIVSSAQSLALLTGDLDLASDSAIALNDAFLASGASSADAARGLTQYSQMLAAGKVDMQSWRSLQETMGAGLNELAKSFGYTGSSAVQSLYAALRDGEITFDDFNKRLIELDGGVNGFAERARTSSTGIQTSMQNVYTAITKGVANTIQIVDQALADNKLPTIAQMFDKAKQIVNKSFTVIQNAVKKSVGVAAPLLKTLAKHTDLLKVAFIGINAKTIGSSIMSIAGKYDAFKSKMSDVGKQMGLVSKAMETQGSVQAAVSTVIKANTAEIDAETAAQVASNTAITAKNVLLGVLSGQLSLAEAKQLLLNAAMEANPIGILIGAVAALSAAFIGLGKIYDKLHPEVKESAEKQEELAASYEDVAKSADESLDSIEKKIKVDKDSAKEVQDLITKAKSLNRLEKLSANQKEDLAATADQLNEKIEGLGLAYDEVTGHLNLTNDALETQVKHMQAVNEAAKYEQAYNDALEEQAAVTEELQKHKENLAAIEEAGVEAMGWRYNATELYLKSVDEEKEKIAELEAKEKEFADVASEAQMKRRNAQKIASDNIAQAIENETLSLDMLSEENQKTVKELTDSWTTYADVATNMFDELKVKEDASVDDMIATLKKNQETVTAMGDNMESLRQRFDSLNLSQGVLDNLAEMGPEAAGYVAALTTASDGQLTDLATTFADGGSKAKESLFQSLGVDEAELPAGVANLVGNLETSLRENVENADWAGIGESIPSGMTDGMTAGEGDVTEASAKIGKQAEDSMRNQLQTHSPSVVFTQIGKSIPDGLVKGMQGNTVASRAKKMASEIVTSVKTTLSRLSASLGSSKISFAAVQTSTEHAMSSVKTSIVTNMTAGETTVRTKLNSIRSQFSSLRLVTNIASQMASFKSALATGLASAASVASTQMAAVNAALSGGYNIGYANGKNIGDGFYHGMQAWLRDIKAMGRYYVGAVDGTIRVTGHIGSPSRLTRKLGSFMGQGYWLGMNDEMSHIEWASKKMAQIASSISVPGLPQTDYTATVSYAGIGALELEDAGIGGLVGQLAEAINSRPVEVPLYINGREFAQATTGDITAEQEYQTRLNNWRAGTK